MGTHSQICTDRGSCSTLTPQWRLNRLVIPHAVQSGDLLTLVSARISSVEIQPPFNVSGPRAMSVSSTSLSVHWDQVDFLYCLPRGAFFSPFLIYPLSQENHSKMHWQILIAFASFASTMDVGFLKQMVMLLISFSSFSFRRQAYARIAYVLEY